MISVSIMTAYKHAARATGLLVLMGVVERANLQRLRDAKRALDEAGAQTQQAIDEIERKLINAPT